MTEASSSHCSDLPFNPNYHSSGSGIYAQKMRRLQRQIETISTMKKSHLKSHPQTASHHPSSLAVNLANEQQFASPCRWSLNSAFESRRIREPSHGKVRSYKWPSQVRHEHGPGKAQGTRYHPHLYPKLANVEQSGSSIAMKNLIADIIDDVIGPDHKRQTDAHQFRSRMSGRIYPQPIAQLYEVPIQSASVPLNLSFHKRETTSSIASPSPSNEPNISKPTTEETNRQSKMNEFCLRKLKLHQSTATKMK